MHYTDEDIHQWPTTTTKTGSGAVFGGQQRRGRLPARDPQRRPTHGLRESAGGHGAGRLHLHLHLQGQEGRTRLDHLPLVPTAEPPAAQRSRRPGWTPRIGFGIVGFGWTYPNNLHYVRLVYITLGQVN